MTLGLWIDPADANAVVRSGSPETDAVASISDKSDSLNDVVGKTSATLQCNFEGANGATSYTSEDANAVAFTFVGGAQITNAQVKFGSTSLDANAISDRIHATPSPNILAIGTQDFSIQFWVRSSSFPSNYNAIFDQRPSAASVSPYIGYDGTAGALKFYVNGADRIVGGAMTVNVWHHVCVERQAGTTKMYLDGTQTGSNYTDSNNYLAADTSIGARSSHNPGAGIVGWIDDFRMDIGKVFYGGAFTPPTRQFETGPLLEAQGLTSPESVYALNAKGTALSKANASPILTNMDGPDLTVMVAHKTDLPVGSPVDLDARVVGGTLIGVTGDASPLDNTGWRIKAVDSANMRASVGDEASNFVDLTHSDSATILVDFNGADGDTSLFSKDPNRVALNFQGGAQIDTAQSKFGGSSLLCTTGSPSDRCDTPNLAEYALGTGDFTIEFWFRASSFPATAGLIDQRTFGQTVSVKPTIYTSTGQLIYYVNGAARISGSTLSTGQWYHIAVSRVGGTTRMYLDGVQEGSSYADSNNYGAEKFRFGSVSDANASPMDGWIDSVRIIVGTGLYSASFTPPTKPFASTYSLNGYAISGMVLDQGANMLVGYNNGRDTGANVYSGTLGFAHDLQIGDYNDGQIGEVVYVDRALRTDERQRIEGYLAHEWNFSTALPEGHPFKDQAPDIVNNAGLILNFTGIDNEAGGSPEYLADTGQVVTFAGNAVIVDDIHKYGGSSAKFDGTGDYVTVPDADDWHFGSGDFTIECWVRFNDTTGQQNFVAQWPGSTNRGWILEMLSSSTLRFVWSTNGTDVQTHSMSWSPSTNVWYHVAMVRVGNVTRGFVDGVQVGSDDSTISGDTLFNSTAPLAIGGRSDTTQPFDGWIDSVRVTKGASLYQRTFTPPTRSFRVPLTAQLIANFNGADAEAGGSPEYLADSGQVMTFAGNAQLDTAEKRFGVSSLRVDGTGDDASVPDSTDWEFGAGDFTVECWVKLNSAVSGVHPFLAFWTTTGNQRSWMFGLDSGPILKLWYTANGSTQFSSSHSWSPALDTWYHVAVCRYGDELSFFVDGALLGTNNGVSTNFFAATSPLYIGANPTGSQYFDGWIDGARVIKGTSLYNSIEAPDTLYDPATDDAALLINCEGADAATTYTTDDANALVCTFTGTAEIDTAEVARGTSSFKLPDGANYVTVPSDPALALGTGDFTLEFFVRYATLSGSKIIYDLRAAGGTEMVPTIYHPSGTTGINYYVNGAIRITGGDAIATGRWYHIVLERASAVTRLYMDGVQQGADWADTSNYLNQPHGLGVALYSPTAGFDGWMDGVRLTVGRARYQGDFTAPIDAPGEPVV